MNAKRMAGALIVAGVVSAGCDRPERLEMGPRHSAGTLEVEGAELYYQIVGEGRPLVVVHGGPGLDHSYLMPWLEPLAGTYKLVLYDQRGVGGSTGALDSASISMTRYLDDLDAVRERLVRRGRVTLLAHSWGTLPALLYAIRWPERVDGLILVGPVEPGQRYAQQLAERQATSRSPEDQAAIDSLVNTAAFRSGDPGTVSRVFFHAFRGTFADPSIADSGFAVRMSERTARQGRIVARLLMTPLAGLDLWDVLPTLEIPVLLVHGTGDPTPIEMVRELESTLPDARLIEIEGAGHFPFIERPAELFSAVDAFVREIDAIP